MCSALCLALTCASAHAEWLPVSASDAATGFAPPIASAAWASPASPPASQFNLPAKSVDALFPVAGDPMKHAFDTLGTDPRCRDLREEIRRVSASPAPQGRIVQVVGPDGRLRQLTSTDYDRRASLEAQARQLDCH